MAVSKGGVEGGMVSDPRRKAKVLKEFEIIANKREGQCS